jgi:hypothetical protein
MTSEMEGGLARGDCADGRERTVATRASQSISERRRLVAVIQSAALRGLASSDGCTILWFSWVGCSWTLYPTVGLVAHRR